MKFSLNIIDWQARAPGLSDATEWQAWSRLQLPVDPAAPLPRLTALPMMTARRLNSGSKLAVDIGLAMLQHHAIDAVVYSSRHGELERNYRILHALATGQSVSPTDFAMSVHNSAVGNLTITARQAIVSSSISAGLDTFQQALCEVLSLLQAGYSRVLLVDFDGALPISNVLKTTARPVIAFLWTSSMTSNWSPTLQPVPLPTTRRPCISGKSRII